MANNGLPAMLGYSESQIRMSAEPDVDGVYDELKQLFICDFVDNVSTIKTAMRKTQDADRNQRVTRSATKFKKEIEREAFDDIFALISSDPVLSNFQVKDQIYCAD